MCRLETLQILKQVLRKLRPWRRVRRKAPGKLLPVCLFGERLCAGGSTWGGTRRSGSVGSSILGVTNDTADDPVLVDELDQFGEDERRVATLHVAQAIQPDVQKPAAETTGSASDRTRLVIHLLLNIFTASV